MHSPAPLAEHVTRRRSTTSRGSSSSSPLPLNDHHNNSYCKNRRNSDVATDSLMNNHFQNGNGTSASSSGAVPLTKNVGVSVNFGKANVKSNSSSTAGAQHIAPNGHHEEQQHTPGITPSVMTLSSVNSPSSNNNNNTNSAVINLGHGHIGTIAGPPSVSISSGAGVIPSLSSSSVKQNSLSTSPAAIAPTTCANKGVPLSHNQEHLATQNPTTSHPHNSLNSPIQPVVNNGFPESLQSGCALESSKNGNTSSSSSFTSSSSRHCGNSNTKTSSVGSGNQTGPNSPSASSTTSSCSGGSKSEVQQHPAKGNAKNTPSTTTDGSHPSTNPNRIVSQNVNGTLALTGVPSNDCELQLFRVLQRANLLNYFDVMIELGGDDVQQLCDAGEEEFLEIMALIGMASKPLHVRRLQKALQEWMTQPALFQAPVLPPGYPGSSTTPLSTIPQLVAAAGMSPVLPHVPYQPMHGSMISAIFPSIGNTGIPEGNMLTTPISNHSPVMINSDANLPQTDSHPHLASVLDCVKPTSQRSPYPLHNDNRNSYSHGKEKAHRSSPTVSLSDVKIPEDQLIPSHFLETRIRTNSELSSPVSSLASSPHPDGRRSISPVPLSLQDHEVQKLADAAIHHIRSLPPTVSVPKFTAKRKTSADYELILRLSDADPRKMDEVRRVAAVYGRADAKRKSLKPLSMHELAINEAASQLCKHIPALLTKREELLSLSRQVLRESGLPYAAVSSTFSIPIPGSSFASTLSSNNSLNNNDINTKSRYEDASSRLHHKNRESSDGLSYHAKRLRLDNSSGVEIQEFSHNRSPSSQNNPLSPSGASNGMQITELRSLPLRRTPSEDNLSSPLELVTVTSTDLRKPGTRGVTSKSTSSRESNSPPVRRPYIELDDLNSSSNGNYHYVPKIGHQQLINSHSARLSGIPVNSGNISILNQNGNASNPPLHHFPHPIYYQYNTQGLRFTPIKSEPTVN